MIKSIPGSSGSMTSHNISLPSGSKPDSGWAARVGKEFGLGGQVGSMKSGGNFISGGAKRLRQI